MAKHRSLTDILNDMQSEINNSDLETAHSSADYLLVEALKKLADVSAPGIKVKILKKGSVSLKTHPQYLFLLVREQEEVVST